MASEVLEIIVRQRGARNVARDLGMIADAAQRASTNLKGLNTATARTQTGLTGVAAKSKQASAGMRSFGGAAMGAKHSLTALGTGFALIGGAITAGLGRPLKNAVKRMGDETVQALKDAGWEETEVALVIPHPANFRIIAQNSSALRFCNPLFTAPSMNCS